MGVLSALWPRSVILQDLGVISSKREHQGRQCSVSELRWEGRSLTPVSTSL